MRCDATADLVDALLHVAADRGVELLYHCVTNEGQLLAGWSEGTVDLREDGKTELAFTWGWLAGASGGGESRYVEVEGLG